MFFLNITFPQFHLILDHFIISFIISLGITRFSYSYKPSGSPIRTKFLLPEPAPEADGRIYWNDNIYRDYK